MPESLIGIHDWEYLSSRDFCNNFLKRSERIVFPSYCSMQILILLGFTIVTILFSHSVGSLCFLRTPISSICFSSLSMSFFKATGSMNHWHGLRLCLNVVYSWNTIQSCRQIFKFTQNIFWGVSFYFIHHFFITPNVLHDSLPRITQAFCSVTWNSRVYSLSLYWHSRHCWPKGGILWPEYVTS